MACLPDEVVDVVVDVRDEHNGLLPAEVDDDLLGRFLGAHHIEQA